MHPADHMSIGVEYSIDPKSISGALYHRVTTSCVYGLIGIENILASPKSQIFKLSVDYAPVMGFINRFWGFRSLCNIRLA